MGREDEGMGRGDEGMESNYVRFVLVLIWGPIKYTSVRPVGLHTIA